MGLSQNRWKVKRAERNRALGLCRECEKPAEPRRRSCSEHLSLRVKLSTQTQDRRSAAGLCVDAGCSRRRRDGKVRCDFHTWKNEERRLRKTYGISPEEFAARLEKQGNACAICRRGDCRLGVDHNHKTKEVRGLLCDLCNQGIGLMREDIAALAAAIRYLQQ